MTRRQRGLAILLGVVLWTLPSVSVQGAGDVGNSPASMPLAMNVQTPESRTAATSSVGALLNRLQQMDMQQRKMPGYTGKYLSSRKIRKYIDEAFPYKDGKFYYNSLETGKAPQPISSKDVAVFRFAMVKSEIALVSGNVMASVLEPVFPAAVGYQTFEDPLGHLVQRYQLLTIGSREFTMEDASPADATLLDHGIIPYHGQDYNRLDDAGLVVTAQSEAPNYVKNIRVGKLVNFDYVGVTWDAAQYPEQRGLRYGYTFNGIIPSKTPKAVTFGVRTKEQDDTSEAVTFWTNTEVPYIGSMDLSNETSFQADGYRWYRPTDRTAREINNDPYFVKYVGDKGTYTWEKIKLPDDENGLKAWDSLADRLLMETLKETNRLSDIDYSTGVINGVPSLHVRFITKNRHFKDVIYVPADRGYYKVQWDVVVPEKVDVGFWVMKEQWQNLRVASIYVPPQADVPRVLIRSESIFGADIMQRMELIYESYFTNKKKV